MSSGKSGCRGIASRHNGVGHFDGNGDMRADVVGTDKSVYAGVDERLAHIFLDT